MPTFEMLDAVSKGVVEIGYPAQVYWRGKIPFTLWTWGVPFAFSALDHYDYLWRETGLIDVVRDAFAAENVHFLGPVYSDECGATMSREKLSRLSDFNGVKIRSFGLGAEIWKSQGASIVTTPGEEQYTAITSRRGSTPSSGRRRPPTTALWRSARCKKPASRSRRRRMRTSPRCGGSRPKRSSR